MSRRSLLVYLTLTVAWAVVLAWQAAEHRRVNEAARELLRHRGRDITSTLGIVVRSQRRFGGIVSRERMESALSALIRTNEVNSIALLSASGEVVATAGERIEFKPASVFRPGEVWTEQTVTLMNLVDLGANLTNESDITPPRPPPPPIIMPREEIFLTFETNRPPAGSRPPRDRPPPADQTEVPTGATENPVVFTQPPPAGTNDATGSTNTAAGLRGPRPPRGPFVRPNWMNPDEFQLLITKQGVHSFLIVMSTASVIESGRRDVVLRLLVAVLATVAASAMAFGWRNLVKSSELQIRLVKASEMNAHLKELNLAAAGLAHETRNPLNLIRGMAQLISKEPAAPADIRDRSRAIVDEADRVTVQLNEFINYSRPRDIRRSPVAVGHVAAEVARALSIDTDEKRIDLAVPDDSIVIEADEQLLRQALFNLLLNAIQAADAGGRIEVLVGRENGGAWLEVVDNGPGVPVQNRTEIFKPYFTSHKEGTGLGLAVVQQIVSAHGWSIECLANEPRGARFRITHLKALNKA